MFWYHNAGAVLSLSLVSISEERGNVKGYGRLPMVFGEGDQVKRDGVWAKARGRGLRVVALTHLLETTQDAERHPLSSQSARLHQPHRGQPPSPHTHHRPRGHRLERGGTSPSQDKRYSLVQQPHRDRYKTSGSGSTVWRRWKQAIGAF
jgi:hypothetical protein